MQTSNVRSVIIIVLVGIALLLAAVLGIRWMKDRATSYTQPATPVAEPAQPESPQSSPVQEQPAPSPQIAPVVSVPAIVAPPATPTPVAVVPATGPADVLVSIVGLSIVAFSISRYAQARRRLLTIR